jgi:hypothetical protein
MKKQIFMAGVAAISLLASCSKTPEAELKTQSEPVIQSVGSATADSYFPMQVGNYWVYKNYFFDSTGTQTNVTRNKYDSIVVEKDTTIAGKEYAKLAFYYYFENEAIQPEGASFYRDSLGYIVNIDGTRIFSQTDFNDDLIHRVEFNQDDTMFIYSVKMERFFGSVEIENEVYNTILNARSTVYSYMRPEYINVPLYGDNLFAKNIGRVLLTNYFLNSRGKIEKRLIRYSVQ